MLSSSCHRPVRQALEMRKACGTISWSPRGRCSRCRVATGSGPGSSTDIFGSGSNGFSAYTGAGSLGSQEFNLAPLAPTAADAFATPEVVWAPGKSPEQIAMKLMSLTERQRVAMAARVDPATYSAVRMHAPGVEYNARARTLKLRSATADQLPKPRRLPGSMAVVSADTADQEIAEEVRVLADYMGAYAFPIKDVGAANLHALLSNLDALRAADVVVVVAGTDVALPSLVAGLTQAPVVAVPTSAGFGASLGGLAPLLAALSANTPGISLCNIDNGYGASAMAVRMLKMAARLHAVRSAAEAAQAAVQAAEAAVTSAMSKSINN